MSDQMNQFSSLLDRLNRNIERVEKNLEQLKKQREAVLAIVAPPTAPIKGSK